MLTKCIFEQKIKGHILKYKSIMNDHEKSYLCRGLSILFVPVINMEFNKIFNEKHSIIKNRSYLCLSDSDHPF